MDPLLFSSHIDSYSQIFLVQNFLVQMIPVQRFPVQNIPGSKLPGSTACLTMIITRFQSEDQVCISTTLRELDKSVLTQTGQVVLEGHKIPVGKVATRGPLDTRVEERELRHSGSSTINVPR